MARLEAYCFTVQEMYKRKAPVLPLSYFDGKNCTKAYLQRYLTQHSHEVSNIETLAKCIQIKNLTTRDDEISGLLAAGSYGTSSPIVDSKSKKMTHNKLVSEAEMIPHFFYFLFPAGGSKGILLTEKRGISGVFSIISSVADQFQQETQKYRLQFEALMPEGAVAKLIQDGRICEARFTFDEAPEDFAEVLLNKGTKREAYRYETVLRAPGLFRRLPFRNAIKSDPIRILSQELGQEIREVKLKIEMGGVERTVNLSKPDRLKATFDVHDKVNIAADGFPLFVDMHAAAQELAADLMAGITI